jgi:hypothetical protein
MLKALLGGAPNSEGQSVRRFLLRWELLLLRLPTAGPGMPQPSEVGPHGAQHADRLG